MDWDGGGGGYACNWCGHVFVWTRLTHAPVGLCKQLCCRGNKKGHKVQAGSESKQQQRQLPRRRKEIKCEQNELICHICCAETAKTDLPHPLRWNSKNLSATSTALKQQKLICHIHCAETAKTDLPHPLRWNSKNWSATSTALKQQKLICHICCAETAKTDLPHPLHWNSKTWSAPPPVLKTAMSYQKQGFKPILFIHPGLKEELTFLAMGILLNVFHSKMPTMALFLR